jgi:putative transposase
MAHPQRVDFPGAVHHVTGRGNDRQPIFRADGDRQYFLWLLGTEALHRSWRCHAFCLMDNHYHAVIQTASGDLGSGMQRIASAYTRMFNRVYERSGHLFGGRYRSQLVERDEHVIELARYIALNPVRAGLCRIAEDWPWSSYGHTVRGMPLPAGLGSDWLLSQFGSTRASAVCALRLFVADAAGNC